MRSEEPPIQRSVSSHPEFAAIVGMSREVIGNGDQVIHASVAIQVGYNEAAGRIRRAGDVQLDDEWIYGVFRPVRPHVPGSRTTG